MIRGTKAALALVVVAAVAAAVVAAGSASPQQGARTVTIGWAYDGIGNMSFFDGPAVATAKTRIAQINKTSPIKLKLLTCNTQGNKAAIAKSCATKLLGQGADIIMTTCDVDLAAPVVQESINRGKLTVATCIGTDQMGPKRFGAKGRLAFSYGNLAQDEGSAMAEFAWKRGWRSASLATDTVIVYFRNVVQAFEARWRQLGGKVVTEETYQSAGGSPASWQNVVTRLNSKRADVIVTSTAAAYGAQVPIMNGLRTLGNRTPILNSWAGDGNYWYGAASPPVSNYFYVTFASAFGDDPVRAVNQLAARNKAAIQKVGSTGAFVTGPAAIDGIMKALRRTGSTNGAKLATAMEKFKNVPTISGRVSFSKTSHTVFGRKYRVIRVENNVPHVLTTITAKVIPKI